MAETLKILFTGFEKFGRHQQNPTQKLIEAIAAQGLDLDLPEFEIRTKLLPVLYNKSWTELHTVIQHFKPVVILCFGLKAGTQSILVETRAQNFDGGKPDNRQVRRQGVILENGQSHYETRILKERALLCLNKAGLPTDFSHDCGDFVCNHLFYQLMHHCQSQPNLSAAFYHVPNWPSEPEFEKLLLAAKVLATTASLNHLEKKFS